MFPISVAHTHMIGAAKMFFWSPDKTAHTYTHTDMYTHNLNEQWKFNSKLAFHSIFIQFIK